MNQSMFLAIVAVIFGVFGIAMLFVPDQVWAFYGVALTAAGVLLARLIAAKLIGLAIVFWGARGTGVVQSVLIAGLVVNVIDLVLAAMATMGGLLGPMGWSAVVLHIILALGFAYFAFGRR